MDQPLAGKTALVTGASRGIGRAIALALARAGSNVIVHYGRAAAEAQALVGEINALGVRSEAIAADLEQHEQVLALFPQLDAALQRIDGSSSFDILVNNAGVATFCPFAEFTAEAFDRLFAVNVKAPTFIIQQALPRLREGGRIILTSSAVTRANFFAEMITPYASSKGAIDVLTRYVAEIAAPRNITVNSVNPGVIATDMAAFSQTPEGADQVKAAQLLKRIGQPDDVASIVAFLAGPDSAWITGQQIDASGGSKL